MMSLFRRRRPTPPDMPAPLSTLKDADEAYEVANREFVAAVHEAAKNIEGARQVQHQRIKNHLGPAFAVALGTRR
jgi:hypothetical protein